MLFLAVLLDHRHHTLCCFLKWSVEVPEDQVAEQLFAEHMWKEVLNKSGDTDYQAFWEKDLSESFLVVRTQDNAYFRKKSHYE